MRSAQLKITTTEEEAVELAGEQSSMDSEAEVQSTQSEKASNLGVNFPVPSTTEIVAGGWRGGPWKDPLTSGRVFWFGASLDRK